MTKRLAPLLALLLAACAQVPTQTGDVQPALSRSEAKTRYEQGLTNYREGRVDAALRDLNAVLPGHPLREADTLDARKHLAFIHCANSRELLCREQFQAILKEDPKFDLAPNEAGHPLWGPVWRSVKGASDEQRAVTRAGSSNASAPLQKLAEGIREYDAGSYKDALEALQSALKGGLSRRDDEIRAHKYAAFIYCLTQRQALCHTEFSQIFTLDPAFELLPSEAGHPSWAKVYSSAKAGAAKPAPKK